MGERENCIYHAEHKTRIERNEEDIKEIKGVVAKLNDAIDHLQENLNKLVVKFALVNGIIIGLAQGIPLIAKYFGK